MANEAHEELCYYLDWNVHLKDDIILPLYHNCNFEELKSYLHNRRVKRKECEVFPEEKCYAFYGASRFRQPGEDERTGLKRARFGDIPACLILKTEQVENLFRIYPFDTGSACNPRTTKRGIPYEADDIKDRLHIGNKFIRVNKVILHFFKDLHSYIEGNLTRDQDGNISGHYKIPGHVDAFNEIEILHNKVNRGDKREICTEFIFGEPIPLNPDVIEGYIIPSSNIPDLIKLLENYKEIYKIEESKAKTFPSHKVLTGNCYDKIEEFSMEFSKKLLC